MESHTTHIIPPAKDNVCEVSWFVRDSGPQLFTVGRLHKLPMQGMYQNSSLPEERQVFRRNYSVPTNRLGTMTHSYHLGKVSRHCRKMFPTQVPICQPRSQLASRFSKDSKLMPAMLNSFLHRFY